MGIHVKRRQFHARETVPRKMNSSTQDEQFHEIRAIPRKECGPMKDIATLCIIDDIPSVVEGIATQIDWAGCGIRVAGTALDGEEGLQLIRRERPDIVLTDIRMPNMD